MSRAKRRVLRIGEYKPNKFPAKLADGSWEVADFYLGAWLNARGHYVRIDIVSDRYSAVCVFADKPSFQEDCDALWRGESMPIKRFLDAVYTLKKGIFEAKNNIKKFRAGLSQ